MKFAADVGKDAYDIWVFGAGVAVEKAVELFAVAMEIYDESYLSLSAYLMNEASYCCYLGGAGIFFSSVPFTIKVLSC